MRRFLICLFASCGFTLAFSGLRASEEVRVTAADVVAPDLEEPLRQLLKELRDRHLLRLDDGARDAVLQSLLRTLGTGGTVVQDEAGGEASPAVNHIALLRDRFLYVAVGSVTEGLAERLRNIEEETPLSADNGGVILDLRGSNGDNLAEVAAVAEVLSTWDHPFVSLVNGKTRAAGEALAATLRTDQGSILIGSATRGLPYPLKTVTLAGGVSVRLPDVPKNADPKPLIPDVAVPSEGADARTHAGAENQAIPPRTQNPDGDPCVRKAVDLLTAISAFRQKHF